jgi:hypothetical protein
MLLSITYRENSEFFVDYTKLNDQSDDLNSSEPTSPERKCQGFDIEIGPTKVPIVLSDSDSGRPARRRGSSMKT